MNRATDPEGFDPAEKRTSDDRLCALHHQWLKDHTQYLKDIFVTLRGNGHVESGMQWKQAEITKNVLDLRADVTEVTNFIKGVKKHFRTIVWTVLSACVTVIGKMLVLPMLSELWKLVVAHGTKV